MLFRVVAIAMLLMSSLALADKNYFYECQHRDRMRIIEVIYDNIETQVPCSVRYHKSTGSDQLWTAANKVGYCEEKAAEFVEKQKGWGWGCELVSEDYSGSSSESQVATEQAAIAEIGTVDQAEEVQDEIDQTSCHTEYCRQIEILLVQADERIKTLEAENQSLKNPASENPVTEGGEGSGLVIDESSAVEQSANPEESLGTLVE